MLNVKIKPERINFQKPVKGSKDAACWDVYASKIEEKPDGLVIVYLGFSTEIPVGYKGVIVARSNITKYGWCIPNAPGQIDPDFRNEWQVRFRRLPMFREKELVGNPRCKNGEGELYSKTQDFLEMHSFPYKQGERVAQIYFEKEEEVVWQEVKETNDTERGLGGFESTGRS